MLENSSKLISNMCINIFVFKKSLQGFLLLFALEGKYRILANSILCPSSMSTYIIFFWFYKILWLYKKLLLNLIKYCFFQFCVRIYIFLFFLSMGVFYHKFSVKYILFLPRSYNTLFLPYSKKEFFFSHLQQFDWPLHRPFIITKQLRFAGLYSKFWRNIRKNISNNWSFVQLLLSIFKNEMKK